MGWIGADGDGTRLYCQQARSIEANNKQKDDGTCGRYVSNAKRINWSAKRIPCMHFQSESRKEIQDTHHATAHSGRDAISTVY